VDGWRRPKPEWWHLRHAYSPVRVATREVPEGAQPIPVRIENRFDFTSLAEVRCEWQLGGAKGVLSPDIPARSQGIFFLPARAIAGGVLSLRFVDARGRTLDEYALPVAPTSSPTPRPPTPGPRPTLTESPASYTVTGRGFALTFARASGAVVVAVLPSPAGRVQDAKRPTAGGEAQLGGEATGPFFAASQIGTARDAALDTPALPAREVAAETLADCVLLRWSKDAPFGKLSYSLRVYGDGIMKADCELHWSGEQVGVREIGLLWQRPADCQRLSWQRKGQWTVYPPDHIGRLLGQTVAFPPIPAGKKRPDSWALDADKRGCNDFRSTKYDILSAALTALDGTGLRVLSDGRQSVRATVRPDGAIALRVNDFANGGGESFLSGQYARDQRTLKPGDVVTASALVQLVPAR